MAGKDAKVTIGADASAVERACAVAKTALKDLGTSATAAIGQAAQVVATDLANVALAQGKVSFSSQLQQVREFEASTARLAVAVGRDLEAVRKQHEATGHELGKRPQEVAAWSAEVGKLTYSFDGAAASMKGIAGLAAETGRMPDDYKGLAVELGTVGKVAGDTTHVLGVMHAQSDRMGVSGGIAAFADQVDGLRKTISHFAVKSEQDFLRVTAAAAVLGKGLNPQAAGRVQQAALSFVSANAIQLERVLGRRITDEHGQVQDPTAVLRDYVAFVKKHYGERAERNLQFQLGTEAGSAVFRADYSKVDELAKLAPSAAPQQALDKYLATDAGKRDVAQADLAASSRDLFGSSTKLGGAADKLQQWAANNPITTTFLTSIVGGTLSNFMSGFGKSLSTLMGGKGEGGAVKGLYDVATKGTPLGGLRSLPVIGAGVLGFGAGVEIGNALEDKYGNTDWYHADVVYEEKKKLAAANAEIAAAKRKRDAVRLARLAVQKTPEGVPLLLADESASPGPWAPGATSTAPAALANAAPAPQGDKTGSGADQVDALRSALSGLGITVEIHPAVDVPLTATARMTHSSAAGSQAHPG